MDAADGMDLDPKMLHRFELALDPMDISRSRARVVGHGEMSAIFEIHGQPDRIYKRMPLFTNIGDARAYQRLHRDYCQWLTRAGIHLPHWGTALVALPRRPVILYISQEKIPGHRICHRYIAGSRKRAIETMDRVLEASRKIWDFNRGRRPGLEIAVDGQLSNWALTADDTLVYLDTGTPFIRCNGIHQLDRRIVLNILPPWLRWAVPPGVAREVMDRYYHPRKNMVDLLANLYKEQLPHLIPRFIPRVNAALPRGHPPITPEAVRRYYRGDKAIWQFFEGLRKMDRWVRTRLLHQGYPHILPGTIQR